MEGASGGHSFTASRVAELLGPRKRGAKVQPLNDWVKIKGGIIEDSHWSRCLQILKVVVVQSTAEDEIWEQSYKTFCECL